MYEPAFISPNPAVFLGDVKQLWATLPAYDILNLAEKEGEGHEEELFLFFASKLIMSASMSVADNFKRLGTSVM